MKKIILFKLIISLFICLPSYALSISNLSTLHVQVKDSNNKIIFYAKTNVNLPGYKRLPMQIVVSGPATIRVGIINYSYDDYFEEKYSLTIANPHGCDIIIKETGVDYKKSSNC